MAKKSKIQNNLTENNSENSQSDNFSESQENGNQPNNQIIDQDQNKKEIIEQEPDCVDIPFQQYRKSFCLFKTKSRSQQFKTYAKIKSQFLLENFKKSFTQISGLTFSSSSQQNEENQQKLRKPNKQKIASILPLENIFACQMPTNATIFIHVVKIDTKRCHIKVINSTGYVYAYFVDIRTSRKFAKIYKVLKTIGKKNLFIINDENHEISKQGNFVSKISDFANDFCYYFLLKDQSETFKFLTLSINQNFYQRDKKGHVFRSENIFCFYSNIFEGPNEKKHENLNKTIEIQQRLESCDKFRFIQSNSEDSLSVILESVFINYAKFKKIHNREELFTDVKAMIERFQDSFTKKKQMKYGNPDDHYPEKMQICKQCVHCPFNKTRINKLKNQSFYKNEMNVFSPFSLKQSTIDEVYQHKQKENIKKKDNKKGQKMGKNNSTQMQDQELYHKIRKSKYRCQGCSAGLKKDVPLCLECFRDYHIKKNKVRMRNQQKRNAKTAKNKIQKQPQKQQAKQNVLPTQCKSEHIEEQLQLKKLSSSDANISSSQNSENSQIQMIDQGQEQSEQTRQTSKSRELNEIDEFNMLIEAIEKEKETFLEVFGELLGNSQSRKIALTIAQFMEYKISGLFYVNKNRI